MQKAQEGCNDVCAFCIVPRTRGRERSIPPDEVARTVLEREQDGVQEVVITGTQLGAYGRDLDTMRYGPAAVIRAVLAETAVPRVRFSSLQPQDITPELLSLWEDPRLCRHFHLALQSGSEGVVRRMRRRYTLGRYREALAMIRDMVPDVAITTDVIAGFPGETNAEAEESLAFCHEAGFAQMHVFPYSRRPGTTAHLLKDHVPEPVKRARMDAMLALARDSAAGYRARFIGRTEPVLWESSRPAPDGGAPVWEGLTDTYVRVYTRSNADLANRLLPVTLTAQAEDGLWASPPADQTGNDAIIPLTLVQRR
jgi:threonylcarbamoyladenosine tRNA methylthiotransferase MtaB